MNEKRFLSQWSGCAHGCKTAEVCLARRKRHNALVKQIVKKEKVNRLVVSLDPLVPKEDPDPDNMSWVFDG